jgi:IS1 family transposase
MKITITLHCPDCQSTNIKKTAENHTGSKIICAKNADDTYHRETGEIVAFVWGKRDLKTAKRLKKKLSDFRVNYGRVATDDRDSFISTFSEGNHLAGKEYTVGIEGNNCRLRHRIRRAFRKTCCFSKKLFNHLKAFNPVFCYINFGFV